MKSLFLLTALFFIPILVFSQCEYCTIVRGDANCDGSVNITDVLNISNGVFANADAADANDDGAVDISDAIYLSHYLFMGTAAPPCPHPDAGHDCTADGLETCCSPPKGRYFGTLPNTGNLKTDSGNPNWDQRNVSWVNYGFGLQKGRIIDSNTSSCSHGATLQTHDLGWSVVDSTGYTKKRLLNGIQKASLLFYVDLTFTRGDLCSKLYCSGSNKLRFRMDNATIAVAVRPKGGLSTDWVEFIVSQDIEFEYKRAYIDNRCTMLGPVVKIASFTLTWDISDELASMVTDDCSEMIITAMTANSMALSFELNNSEDIATTEKIKADVSMEVSYWWCACQ